MQEKINLSNGVRLSKNEMKNVMGGISAEEYCAILDELWKNNADSWDADTIEGWWYGYSKYCKHN